MRRLVLSLLFGLLIGLAIGLTLGWAVLPVEYVDSPMRNLSPRFKDEYAIMVATAFQVERAVDPVEALNTARLRLTPMVTGNVFTFVRDVAERYISQGGPGRESDIRMLVELSCAFGYCTEPMQPFRLPPATLIPGT